MTLSRAAPPDFRRDGLARELALALDSDALACFEDVVLLGFSLGGHAMLRACCVGGLRTRVRSLILFNTPVDLAALQRHMDGVSRRLYRRVFLAMIRSQYRDYARSGLSQPYPTELDRTRTLYAFDQLLLRHRGGVHSLEEDYQRLSAARHLGELAVPTLMLACVNDPIVPFEQLARAIAPFGDRIDLRRVPGGHIYMPRRVEMGEVKGAPRVVELLSWCAGAHKSSSVTGMR